MAVQGTLLPQTLGLGVALAQSGLLLEIDVMYYTPPSGHVKTWMTIVTAICTEIVAVYERTVRTTATTSGI
jgi:hypothetical protein